jgi:hypothetical protein
MGYGDHTKHIQFAVYPLAFVSAALRRDTCTPGLTIDFFRTVLIIKQSVFLLTFAL